MKNLSFEKMACVTGGGINVTAAVCGALIVAGAIL